MRQARKGSCGFSASTGNVTKIQDELRCPVTNIGCRPAERCKFRTDFTIKEARMRSPSVGMITSAHNDLEKPHPGDNQPTSGRLRLDLIGIGEGIDKSSLIGGYLRHYETLAGTMRHDV